jgi:hypothetical protein
MTEPDSAYGKKCDFCSPPKLARWDYPASTFEVHFKPGSTPPGFRSEGGWLACDECADMIEADDREGLSRTETHRSVLDGFFENRLGERKPFG